MIETNYLVHSEGTVYRVRPNPDSDAVDGSDGVVLEWQEPGDEKWTGYFFISPNSAMEVARAIALLVTGKDQL